MMHPTEPPDLRATDEMLTWLRPRSPLYMREGACSQWVRCFLWAPTRVDGWWAWLRPTWRRRTYPAPWLCPQVGDTSYREYSDLKMGFWEGAESLRPMATRRPRRADSV